MLIKSVVRGQTMADRLYDTIQQKKDKGDAGVTPSMQTGDKNKKNRNQRYSLDHGIG